MIDVANHVIRTSWPKFMLDGFTNNPYWRALFEAYPKFQFLLVEDTTHEVMGVGNSIPLAWADNLSKLPEEGWDWALKQGMEDYAADRRVRTLSALAISVVPKYRGMGISTYLIKAMKAISKRHELETLIVPARPMLKSLYPLTPMKQYINWLNDQSLPFDPWVRAHTKLGGEIIKVCSESMLITGTISDWEQRTRIRFPESGPYIIPDALVPIEINYDKDQGVYLEPNVWLHHRVG